MALEEIARAVKDFDYLYADVGNHNIYDTKLANSYLDQLGKMFSGAETMKMKERVMFGSDWYMLAIHPKHEEFLNQYEDLYRRKFGVNATEAFLGKSALRFLGFDDAKNRNAARLKARYKEEKVKPPAWLAV